MLVFSVFIFLVMLHPSDRLSPRFQSSFNQIGLCRIKYDFGKKRMNLVKSLPIKSAVRKNAKKGSNLVALRLHAHQIKSHQIKNQKSQQNRTV